MRADPGTGDAWALQLPYDFCFLQKGVKSDSPVTYARAEFNNVLLGDSPKLESSAERTAEYNFTFSFDVGPESAHSLDDLAHKPAVLTVLEILPKEKKQKEEKTGVLGQCSVDLLPLLEGEDGAGYIIGVIQRQPNWPRKKVAVSVPAPLLSEEQISNGNLLKVTMEAAYSVPDSWNPAGPQYSYVVGLQIPFPGEKPHSLLFSNGVLKAGGETEPVPRHKKWPVTGIAAINAQHLPDSFITGGSYEQEAGELNRAEDKEFRSDAETHRKRVTWDTERRCFLDPSVLASLQTRIAECRYWPVEIMRLPPANPAKAKTGKSDKGEEDFQVSFHGVAYVNMVPLLYPGVKSLRGAFRVFPYTESEVLEKTKCQASVLRDIIRQPNVVMNKPAAPQAINASPNARQVPSRILKDDKSTKDVSRKVSVTSNLSSVPVQQYAEANTYLVLELSLEKAMVPKRSPEELTMKVQELLPQRPQLPRRTMGAQKAVAEYQNQITSITSALLEEYSHLFGSQGQEGQEVDRQTLEEQKCKLNYELNCTGKYFAFKEQLKHSVVKIVREKYLKTTAFQDPEQLQAFLSDLYVYLVDEMHLTLNKPGVPWDCQDCFAIASKLSGSLRPDLSQCPPARLARDNQCVDHWADYGKFKLLICDHIKAKECFHEALVRDRSHLPSLILCGVTAVLNSYYDEAEVFFEDATCIDPTSVLAWTVLGLFYEIQGNDIRMEMAFSEANRLRQPRAVSRPPPGASDAGPPEDGPAAEGETSQKGNRSKHLMQQKGFLVLFLCPDVWASLGHLHMQNVNKSDARDCYEHTLSLVDNAAEMHPVFLNLGSIYLQDGEYEKAKNTYLMACKQSPTSRTWLGVGTACYRLGDLEEAEGALSEANILNNRNSEVWGHLALICLKVNRQRVKYIEEILYLV
uniref:Cilia and flagella associated protein 70 n=1 Tax=Leptobrachium leishanense TaxID=445787 RepID=A0A8C5QWB7_9ANUR